MISMWEFSLFIGGFVTALVSLKNTRGLIWVLLVMVNFSLCVLYYESGFPHHPAFVLFLDIALCVVIDIFRKTEWELQVYRIYRTSMIVSILMLFELPYMNLVYTPVLEFLNWLALIVIFNNSLVLSNIVGDHVKNYITSCLVFLRCSARAAGTQEEESQWYKRWR